MKSYSDIKTTVKDDVEVTVEGTSMRINFNHGEEIMEREENGKMVKHTQYVSECVFVEDGKRDYCSIVSTIVRDRYTDDDVQAILSNHAASYDQPAIISEPKIDEYKKEYDDFQAWRKRAKEVATIVVERLKTL